jgi:8-oxo-dGTP diphosphatase
MSGAQTVDAIDWSTWKPTVRATLMFVVRDDEILLIRKKRGLGAGKINGPGGKIEAGESPLDCALRETQEEIGVRAINPRQLGELWFHFADGLQLFCTVFRADDIEGTPIETDEATPQWTSIDAIPYGEMWADDAHWLPYLMADQAFMVRSIFDGDAMLDISMQVADELR